MKKKIILILAIFLLTACSKAPAGKQAEILMARDCGFDGLKCCTDIPNCSFGQECCLDPNNPNNNYCADNCSCGRKDKFCCAGNKCDAGLACYGGLCDEWGSEGKICHPEGNLCRGDLVCKDGTCVKCGLVKNPCCAKGQACLQEKGKKAECRENFCAPCGFGDNSACQEGERCLSGNIYNNGHCLRCGDFNLPCCQNEKTGEKYCFAEKGLFCNLGFCENAQK